MKFKVASFFAGVGGIDLGFEQAGFKVIWANEFDKCPAETYALNFDNELVVGDIRELDEKDVPDMDVMIGGFPCQPFSTAGPRKGMGDERGNLFFELERIFKYKKPQVVFFENVKGLVTDDKGNTIKTIMSKLSEVGYHTTMGVLNAYQYGNLAQNRERVYIVGFLDREKLDRFKFPDTIELTHTVRDYLETGSVDTKYYYTKERHKFYEELSSGVDSRDTLYQWRRSYVRGNKKNLCPTLAANMGTGGNNVPIVLVDDGVRRLTPRECFNFQGYSTEFKLSSKMTDSKLYKQAGNSVAVPVIYRIACEIKRVLEN